MKTTQTFLASLPLLSFSWASPCPILGPPYPTPQRLSTSQAFQNGTRKLDDLINQALQNASFFSEYAMSGPLSNGTFSLSIFSTAQPDTLLHEFHYTSSEVANSQEGLHTVDANSIYRIGSVSKLLTVYTFLIHEGFTRDGESVARYIPELAEIAKGDLMSDNGRLVNWTDVTVGDLASQLGGITRDLGLNDNDEVPGVPPLPAGEVALCDHSDQKAFPCSVKEYLDRFATVPAEWNPAHTPTYSNAGFFLLALVLERITGKSFPELMQHSLIEQLGLNSTSYYAPNSTTRAVIPVNDTVAMWSLDIGPVAPSGNYYTSTYDFATIGRSILNSSILSPSLTRRWLKPRTFTTAASPAFDAVGAPWEIIRFRDHERVVDLYTKDGDVGAYHASLVLIPDYNVGWTILTAGTKSTGVREGLNTLMYETILPALEQAAREEANKHFAGTYEAISPTNSTTPPATAIFTTDSHSGLKISSIMIGGIEQTTTQDSPKAKLDWRLFPSDLYNDGKHVGFTAAVSTIYTDKNTKVFAANTCASWLSVGTPSYGSLGLLDFVFEVDEEGRAVSAYAKGFRMKFVKKY
ncbi:hypothetical protein CB0940_09539 [Cercospora beticola]|uniref:Uncharacterized protein n=1 Tax=Cercospora beticola TaxID=122368 RepID=A0A2G5HHL1_CERBT|nr:hypothetical protein CB0940_09539 [Cercospora beticola]PIA92030.1 hypothetical protein CB0940_09539 [Cercospora beticola]WPB06136.1 hypothetical protein RHO25_010793 [Cercospora beticola]